MTHANSPSSAQILRQAASDFFRIASDLLQGMMRLPLPSLLVVCLACALFISILPLALSLFIGFLVFKLIAFLVTPSVAPTQHHDTHDASSN